MQKGTFLPPCWEERGSLGRRVSDKRNRSRAGPPAARRPLCPGRTLTSSSLLPGQRLRRHSRAEPSQARARGPPRCNFGGRATGAGRSTSGPPVPALHPARAAPAPTRSCQGTGGTTPAAPPPQPTAMPAPCPSLQCGSRGSCVGSSGG